MKLLNIRILAAAFSVMMMATLPNASHAQLDISVDFDIATPPPVAIAPPPLPAYIVPSPPYDGVVWQPGYWAWGIFGYYWVPGTWIEPPTPIVLWTPGYWGWSEGNYAWHEGYWGRHVGFYGGVNYGGGYGGRGFNGGHWDHNHFIVNRSVTNVNNITNNYVSFNGGPGGIQAAPNAREKRAEAEKHVPPTAKQTQHIRAAGNNPQLRSSSNNGKPPIAATAKPGEFTGRNVVAAKQAGIQSREAEQHNQQVLQHPSSVKGAAAIPRAENAPAHGEQHGNLHQARPDVYHQSPRKPMEASGRNLGQPHPVNTNAARENHPASQTYPSYKKPMERTAPHNQPQPHPEQHPQAQHNAPKPAQEHPNAKEHEQH